MCIRDSDDPSVQARWARLHRRPPDRPSWQTAPLRCWRSKCSLAAYPVLQDVQRHVRIQLSLLSPPWTAHGIQFSASCLGFTRQQKNTWSTQKFGLPNIAYSQCRFSGSGAFCEGPIVFRFKDLSSGITAPQLERGSLGTNLNVFRIAKILHQLQWNHM